METLIRKVFNWTEYQSDKRNYLCTIEGVQPLTIMQLYVGLLAGVFSHKEGDYRVEWNMDGTERYGSQQHDLIMFIWEEEDQHFAELPYIRIAECEPCDKMIFKEDTSHAITDT